MTMFNQHRKHVHTRTRASFVWKCSSKRKRLQTRSCALRHNSFKSKSTEAKGNKANESHRKQIWIELIQFVRQHCLTITSFGLLSKALLVGAQQANRARHRLFQTTSSLVAGQWTSSGSVLTSALPMQMANVWINTTANNGSLSTSPLSFSLLSTSTSTSAASASLSSLLLSSPPSSFSSSSPSSSSFSSSSSATSINWSVNANRDTTQFVDQLATSIDPLDIQNGSELPINWWNEVPYPQSGYSQLSIILLALFITVIMILIVVGNLLVCIAICTEKALKTIQNWFIASLAVSDLLLGLVIMPFSLAYELMGYWIFGDFWCEVHHALDVLLTTASINNLCLISLDRYWSVTQAIDYLKKRTPCRAIFMIAFAWVFSALVCLPPLVGWKKEFQRPGECELSDDFGYVLYSSMGSFYIPAVVMVFVYAKIFVAARSRARKHVRKRTSNANQVPTSGGRSLLGMPCAPMPSAPTSSASAVSTALPTQLPSSIRTLPVARQIGNNSLLASSTSPSTLKPPELYSRRQSAVRRLSKLGGRLGLGRFARKISGVSAFEESLGNMSRLTTSPSPDHSAGDTSAPRSPANEQVRAELHAAPELPTDETLQVQQETIQTELEITTTTTTTTAASPTANAFDSNVFTTPRSIGNNSENDQQKQEQQSTTTVNQSKQDKSSESNNRQKTSANESKVENYTSNELECLCSSTEDEPLSELKVQQSKTTTIAGHAPVQKSRSALGNCKVTFQSQPSILNRRRCESSEQLHLIGSNRSESKATCVPQIVIQSNNDCCSTDRRLEDIINNNNIQQDDGGALKLSSVACNKLSKSAEPMLTDDADVGLIESRTSARSIEQSKKQDYGGTQVENGEEKEKECVCGALQSKIDIKHRLPTVPDSHTTATTTSTTMTTTSNAPDTHECKLESVNSDKLMQLQQQQQQESEKMIVTTDKTITSTTMTIIETTTTNAIELKLTGMTMNANTAPSPLTAILPLTSSSAQATLTAGNDESSGRLLNVSNLPKNCYGSMISVNEFECEYLERVRGKRRGNERGVDYEYTGYEDDEEDDVDERDSCLNSDSNSRVFYRQRPNAQVQWWKRLFVCGSTAGSEGTGEADGDWVDEEDEADEDDEDEEEDEEDDQFDEDLESRGSSSGVRSLRSKRDLEKSGRQPRSKLTQSNKSNNSKRKRTKRKAQPTASVFSTNNNTSSSGQYSSQSAAGSGGATNATTTSIFQRTTVHSSLISRLTGNRLSGSRTKTRTSSARTYRPPTKLPGSQIVGSCTVLTTTPGIQPPHSPHAFTNSHSTSATTSSGVGTALPTVSSSSSAGRTGRGVGGGRHVPSYIGSSSATGSGSGATVTTGHRYLPSEADRQKRKIAKAREKRATLILGLIMGSFIAGWIPFFGLYLLQGVCKHCQVQAGLTFGYWLGYCNSAINPIIYTVFNRDFRKAFRKILFR